MTATIALAAAAYLIGAVPFGFLLVWAVRREDIRKRGSGNIGSTNVGRVLGRPAGMLVLLLDAAKGYTAAKWLPLLAPAGAGDLSGANLGALLGFLAVCGHSWPVFLRFRGGKGVATSMGVALALAPGETAVAAFAYAAVRFTTGYVSAGSLLAAVTFPVAVLLNPNQSVTRERAGLIALALLLPVLIIARHHQNIRRLWRGEENPVSRKEPGA
jgi:glycerol-3-phosphate acyltransferase PlsY